MDNIYPRLWVLLCVSSQTVEYTSTSYTVIKQMFSSLPAAIRDCFDVVRYDAHDYKIPQIKK